MLNRVFIKNTLAVPDIDEREILRYAGYRGEADGQISALLAACVEECKRAFSYRVCYAAVSAKTLLEQWRESGCLLQRRLENAEYALVFAATVGLEIDRRILQAEARNAAKALLLQAFGAERIESLCNAFCEEIAQGCAARGYVSGARFSAGYGDFPLDRQRDIFALLSCEKNIGLTLNESLLMSPTKSVTAIIPIGKELKREEEGCAACKKQACPYQKREK